MFRENDIVLPAQYCELPAEQTLRKRRHDCHTMMRDFGESLYTSRTRLNSRIRGSGQYRDINLDRITLVGDAAASCPY
jgi:hypothetical protein